MNFPAIFKNRNSSDHLAVIVLTTDFHAFHAMLTSIMKATCILQVFKFCLFYGRSLRTTFTGDANVITKLDYAELQEINPLRYSV